MTASTTVHVLAIAACLAASTRISSGAPLALHAADEPADVSAHDGEGADVRTRRASDWLGIFSNTMADELAGSHDAEGADVRTRRVNNPKGIHNCQQNSNWWRKDKASWCSTRCNKGLCASPMMDKKCCATCGCSKPENGNVDNLYNKKACKKIKAGGQCGTKEGQKYCAKTCKN